MTQDFSMVAPRASARNTMRGIVVMLAAGAVFTLAIAPAGARWLVALLWVPGFVLFYRFMSRMGAVVFRVGGGALDVRGDVFSKSTPIGALRLSEARRLDLHVEPSLEPAMRVRGTGLPGYLGGWFRLRGGEKSFVYLTDRTKAVYIPTTLGYSLLLSPDEPQAFLRALGAKETR